MFIVHKVLIYFDCLISVVKANIDPDLEVVSSSVQLQLLIEVIKTNLFSQIT